MLKLICVGKLKEKYLKDAIDEYVKRIGKFTRIELIEVNDYNYDNMDKAMMREEQEILKFIDSKDYVITLDINGKMLSSVELAQKIDNTFISFSNILFIIGGSNGLSLHIKDRANFSLSFSKMTFPHQLFRVMLLEQIYRSFKINNNEEYHK